MRRDGREVVGVSGFVSELGVMEESGRGGAEAPIEELEGEGRRVGEPRGAVVLDTEAVGEFPLSDFPEAFERVDKDLGGWEELAVLGLEEVPAVEGEDGKERVVPDVEDEVWGEGGQER